MDSVPFQLFIQLVLILINAFFAASEIAVVSLNKTKLKKLSEEGDKTATRLLKFAETPTGFLSTIQIGITLAGFLGSAFAADNFASRLTNWMYVDLEWRFLPQSGLHTINVIIITLILSYFTLVFGELVPKRIAMQKAYGVAKFTSRVVQGLYYVMKPIIWFLSFSTNLVLKIFRYKVEAEEDSVTEEEIKMMVDLGEEKGTVEETESKWIQNIFDFNDTIAREIMTPSRDIVYLKEDATLDEINRVVRESGYSRYPICKSDLNEIIGILNVKDYYSSETKKISELIRPAYFVPETILADDLFHNLQKMKKSLAIVIDEYGTTTGLITTEDLLEEIVGRMYDEYTTPEDIEFVTLEDGSYKVSGNITISDLADYLDMELEESEDYDTVGGLIFSSLGYVPKDGSTFEVEKDNLNFKVTKVKNRRIEEVIITRINDSTNDADLEDNKE